MNNKIGNMNDMDPLQLLSSGQLNNLNDPMEFIEFLRVIDCMSGDEFEHLFESYAETLHLRMRKEGTSSFLYSLDTSNLSILCAYVDTKISNRR